MIELPIITNNGVQEQLINIRNVTRFAPTHDDKTMVFVAVQGSEIVLYTDLKLAFVKQLLNLKNLI